MSTPVLVALWLCAGATYLAVAALALACVLAPDVWRGLVVGSVGVVVLGLAYVLTYHAWYESVRQRNARREGAAS